MTTKSNNYIKSLIEQGEHDHLDFKFAITEAGKIAKSLSAFSNTTGGTLLIGVKDNGVIAGVRSDEEFYMIDSAARRYCKPEVKFTYENWTVGGKNVLEIKISEVKEKPVTCRDEEGSYWAYVRIHDQNILAHPAQILAWKKGQQEEGAFIRYTDKEARLLRELSDFQTLTLSQIKRKTGLKHFELLHLLGDLMSLNIIGINQAESHCGFYLRNIT